MKVPGLGTMQQIDQHLCNTSVLLVNARESTRSLKYWKQVFACPFYWQSWPTMRHSSLKRCTYVITSDDFHFFFNVFWAVYYWTRERIQIKEMPGASIGRSLEECFNARVAPRAAWVAQFVACFLRFASWNRAPVTSCFLALDVENLCVCCVHRNRFSVPAGIGSKCPVRWWDSHPLGSILIMCTISHSFQWCFYSARVEEDRWACSNQRDCMERTLKRFRREVSLCRWFCTSSFPNTRANAGVCAHTRVSACVLRNVAHESQCRLVCNCHEGALSFAWEAKDGGDVYPENGRWDSIRAFCKFVFAVFMYSFDSRGREGGGKWLCWIRFMWSMKIHVDLFVAEHVCTEHGGSTTEICRIQDSSCFWTSSCTITRMHSPWSKRFPYATFRRIWSLGTKGRL